ncbi:hypothetical protein [Streptomyces sp. BE20]|uniref:hypothetical protein n=1 Tax=Streptomycetaceae TaxID=2062 RepID=UPI002E77C128|nr:hypothetical protein [Streptomyces sp. BE20]MEE1822141.1 hypothetical protein [Streptomyces sp. BE20]
MSTVHITAPRVPSQQSAPAGATATGTPGRRRSPLTTAVRNVGIALDTAARVVLLGRDGVKY